MLTRVMCIFIALLLCVGMCAWAGKDCWTWKPLPITQAPDWSNIDLWHSAFTYDKDEKKLALLAYRWDHYIELWYFHGDKFVKESAFKYFSPYDPYGFYFDETLSALVIITCDNCGFECIQAVAYRYEKSTKIWTKIAKSDAISPIALTVAYDSLRKKSVVVGLVHPYSPPYYAFLEFDGTKFDVLPATGGLNMMTGGLIGYDRAAQKIVFWGNVRGEGDETCEYDGNVWVLSEPTHLPSIPNRTDFHGMLFVPDLLGLMSLFLDEDYFIAWLYHTVDWQILNFIISPPPRFDALFGYDENEGKVILVGGWNHNGYMGDSWELVKGNHCRPLSLPK